MGRALPAAAQRDPVARALALAAALLGGGTLATTILAGLGTFGLVIGLLSWIYLAAHLTLLAAEANVVASRNLWPRSFSVLIEQPATSADGAR